MSQQNTASAYAAARAVQLLTGWLAGDALDSRFADYLESEGRDNYDYKHTADTRGVFAADAEVVSRVTKARWESFAAAIRPVAEGMLALAKADTKGESVTAVSSLSEHSAFPRAYGFAPPGGMVAAFNPTIRKAHSSVPHEEIFGHNGSLGLVLVSLQVGYLPSKHRLEAYLTVAVRPRPTRDRTPEPGSFNYVSIYSEGRTSTGFYEPHFEPVNTLRHELGITPLGQSLWASSGSGSSIEYTLGFPGATNYLADVLPKLGEYFTGIAALME